MKEISHIVLIKKGLNSYLSLVYYFACKSTCVIHFIYSLLVFLGLSTFYTELMRGLGATSRLWELTDRKPSIPLTGCERLFLSNSSSSSFGYFCPWAYLGAFQTPEMYPFLL